jgi:AraC-like DNA-binding protein/quercetin dioxygenase-like cupin family protein
MIQIYFHQEVFMDRIVDINPDYCSVEVQFQRVWDNPFHWHNSLEVILVLEGSIHISIVDDTRIMKQGDMEILNINQTHRVWQTEEENMILVLQIEADYARQYFPHIDKIWFSHAFNPSVKVEIPKLQALIAEIYKIVRQYRSKNQPNDSIDESLTSHFLQSLINNFDFMKIQYGDNLIKLARIRRIYYYLHKEMNYLNKITLQDISTQTEEFLNLDYLSTLFRNFTGDNFQNLLHYFRIEYAVKQLLSTNKCITEIAFECGSSATRYFYKHFNALFPEGPKEFRKKNAIRLAGYHSYSVESDIVEAGMAEEGMAKIRSLLENTASVHNEVPKKWIGIYLTELEEMNERDMKTSYCILHAKDFQSLEGKMNYYNKMEAGNIDKILIHGLFSSSMFVAGDGFNVLDGDCKFDNVNSLLRFLQKGNLLPSFFLEYRSRNNRKIWNLLDEFVQNYICLYGAEEVNQWRFQLIT